MKRLFLKILCGVGLSLNLVVADTTTNLANAVSANSTPAQTNQKETDYEAIEKDCVDNKQANACLNLAINYMKFAKTNLLNALDEYKKECDNGNLDSCYKMALFMSDTRYFDKRLLKQSRKILIQNCNKNHKASCEKINNDTNIIMIENDKANKFKQNGEYEYNLAYNYLKIGCSVGDMGVCEIMANLLEKGIGDDNKTKAIDIYEKICKSENNSTACVSLARNYYNGFIIEKDILKAKNIFEKACSENSEYACNELGLIHSENNSTEQARFYFEKACKLNFISSCEKLASYFYMQKDYATATEYFKKGCEKNISYDCYEVADSLEKLNDIKNINEIKKYYDKACELGYNKACEMKGLKNDK